MKCLNIKTSMTKLILKHIYPLAIFLISFIFYIALLPPGITFEDAGYFLAASLNGGYAHPPGYPLYTVLLKIWSLTMGLFSSNAAYIGSLFSAFLSAISLALFYIILKHISNSLDISNKLKQPLLVLLCLNAGLAYEFIEQSILIEVYSLHIILLMSLYLFLIHKKYLLTGLVTGLALCNHTTAVFFFPFIFLWLLMIDNMKLKNMLTPAIKLFIPGTLIGLIPYLYLPLISNPLSPLQWGDPSTYAGFKEIVFRTSYWRLPASNFQTQLEQLKIAFTHFFDQWGLSLISILFLFSVLSYIFIKGPLRKKTLYWHICWIIQVPIMAILANMSNTDEGVKLVSVFFIPGYFFTIICLLLFSQALFSNFPKIKSKIIPGFIALLSISLITSLVYNSKSASMREYNTPRLSTEQVGQMVADEKSIIFTWNDFSFTPLAYEKYVLNNFENMTPIPYSFFKDLGLLTKYKGILKLNLRPLKKAVKKFYLSRPAGHIGTIPDKEFYDAFAENIKIWLGKGYKIYSEYKMTGDGFKTLYFDPKGPFFEILLNKPLKESRYSFLKDVNTSSTATKDVWHKKFLSKYAEQSILRALLNQGSPQKDKYLNHALKYSLGTDSEEKVRAGIKKHFPNFKM